jgi:hypothetical protein
MLTHDRPESALRMIWDDVSAAVAGCAAMAATTVPVELALKNAGAPVLVHLLAVGVVGGATYLATIRLVSRDAWRDLSALVRRVLPVDRVKATLSRRAPRAAEAAESLAR